MSTLFVTDLDGTLLGADARISQESAALLRPMPVSYTHLDVYKRQAL